MNKQYKDPVNSFKSIPDNIINSLQPILEAKKVLLDNIDFTIDYMNVISQNKTYYCILLNIQIHDVSFQICPTNLFQMKPNKQYLIGFIPTNIELHHSLNSNGLKALDCMSTSESLLSRISLLFSNFNMVKEIDTIRKQIYVNGLKSILSTNPSILWRHSKQTYESLLREVNTYE